MGLHVQLHAFQLPAWSNCSSGRAAVLSYIANALFLLPRTMPKAQAGRSHCSFLPPSRQPAFINLTKGSMFPSKGVAHRHLHVLQEPPPPVAEAAGSREQKGMFFVEPRQLLNIYSQLEEQNLFLIQNAQESEEALEELRAKLRSAGDA